MDQETYAVVSIMSAIVCLVVLIYVIVLIKNIERNTRPESQIVFKKKLRQFTILGDKEGLKDYLDKLFAAEMADAYSTYLIYKIEGTPIEVYQKYKEFYEEYNITPPANFDKYQDIEFIKSELK